jgi:hypothetical protein
MFILTNIHIRTYENQTHFILSQFVCHFLKLWLGLYFTHLPQFIGHCWKLWLGLYFTHLPQFIGHCWKLWLGLYFTHLSQFIGHCWKLLLCQFLKLWLGFWDKRCSPWNTCLLDHLRCRPPFAHSFGPRHRRPLPPPSCLQ